ncbi:dihydropteroate synthase [Panacibacter ginsenosidivorans]|uniref:Dihydropteroate synthase n=1 Tax=Panacibacter ginsenosidivorans TaxID=1813871 RepID=A0A5B8VCJ4_9BACT|nr:dihydropteroate synthase [Panacibacter ginsenosidivorans]QEC69022.1 dihydropteroate synthase [Panacibacter ginsenosidivorans]
MFTLNCRGRLLTINQPIVMGIINATPDSFFTGSRQQTIDVALEQAEKMIREGATILDIGGQSTRPGSEKINAAEELHRVLPIIAAIHKAFPKTITSVDTYYASVAKEAVEAGADIINDISGGLMDEQMLSTVAALKTPFVCMHMKGNPQNMQAQAQYENITKEMLEYFIERTEACKLAGITDVIVDPGFGFSKTIAHNFELLRNLSAFKMLEKPILLGLSRKGTIYKTLGITAEEALNGTTVLNTIGLLNGATILRVHDVKEAMETIKLLNAYWH